MSVQVVEQLTLFPEDSPANPFPWLENSLGSKTNAIYGLKCCELSENLRRVGLSLKTFLESCELPGTQFVRTWSVKALTSGFLVMKLRLSERRTDAGGSSLWRTQDAEVLHGNNRGGLQMPTRPSGAISKIPKRSQKSRRRPSNLREQAGTEAMKLWPTPCASKLSGTTREDFYISLPEAVKIWPTPTTRDYRSADTNPDTKRFMAKSELNTAVVRNLRSDAGGQLNPAWVEWLMGFPMKKLLGEDQGASSIEITDKNIKSFEKVARKYGVDFAVRKVRNEAPPNTLCSSSPKTRTH